MIEFKKMYQEFLAQPFPEGLAGREIDGMDLVMLDSEAAGLLQKFINSKGVITGSDLKLLQELNNQLKYAIRKLNNADATYFERLLWLINRASSLEKSKQAEQKQ